MIKTLGILIFVLISLLSTAQKQNEQLRVQSAVIKFFDGIADLNDEDMKAEVSNDFILLEDGKIWNMDSLINVLKPLKSLHFKRINKFDFLKTEQKGDIAWVSYYNSAEMIINGLQRNMKWIESAVLIRDAGLWKIKLLHSTKLKT